MYDLYLSEDAKECIANLRENKCNGLMIEQSLICRAMSSIIFTVDNSGNHDKEEMLHALYMLQRYNELITELSKEN